MPDKLKLERIAPSTSAQDFFTKYVSKRRPVIISGLLDDPSFQGRKWTDLSYLSEKAGDVEVLVEPIHPTANQYGTDVERVPMTFRDFLEKLRHDDGPHPYLTTQYSEEDSDAETVFPPPTNALKDEFPMVPRLMGNLFLQQVNLWLGKSKDGSSSGLHHDFHDNLYCLLQGSKRFVLFPPAEVKHLYPYGTLDTLHPNGLISYADIPVRSDGLSKRAACKARVHALERKIDALKAKVKGKGKDRTQSKEMKALMNAHDEALDELAMLALEDEQGAEEVDDFDALMGDLDDGTDDLGAGSSGLAAAVDEENDEDEAEDDENDENKWPEWKGIGHSDDSEDEDEQGDGESNGQPSEPSSFSRIPTAHLHRYLDIPTTAAIPPDFSASTFPALQKAAAPYVVELSAGEMLYLPASWWHEVTSTSAPPSAGHGHNSGADVHMAFNYWFYPPDALDHFEAPYGDTLVWSYLREKGKAKGPEEKDTGEKVKVGKRAREDGISEGSKKARR
ncbi:Clavaminate synthase-like protein [Dichomitus squalens LYAD-421 SS1]|uniref:Clavaminate synthase-like protein n=1 Tax=Dichomitus squalens (strain LYAD-421) TaxID=732165 RepID=R7SV92_DICSQ|nr:Clavaminate synthase-like protein [Dichomitus squalens LYAD-421 SS1]EJF58902.1 Clavaminate synthase-like protein [Dichomitus squalens LYAD-421 SS1]